MKTIVNMSCITGRERKSERINITQIKKKTKEQETVAKQSNIKISPKNTQFTSSDSEVHIGRHIQN